MADAEQLAAASQPDVEARTVKMVLTNPGAVVASKMGRAARFVTNGLVITILKAVAAVFKRRSKGEKAAMWSRWGE